MTSKRQSPANESKLTRVERAYRSLLEDVLQAGFHGVARLELTISDGTIQTIARAVERIDKESF